MGLKKLAAKVTEYNERLKDGKVSKIKPSHVQKTLEKLLKKSEELKEEIRTSDNAEKKVRLERKLGIAGEHIKRAEWLMEEIS